MKKIDVIDHFGSQVAVKEVLGINKSSVSQWSEIIPEKQALRLEKITKGVLKYDPSLYRKDKAA